MNTIPMAAVDNTYIRGPKHALAYCPETGRWATEDWQVADWTANGLRSIPAVEMAIIGEWGYPGGAAGTWYAPLDVALAVKAAYDAAPDDSPTGDETIRRAGGVFVAD